MVSSEESSNGTTIPVPWPCRQTYRLVGFREAIHRLAVGLLYIGNLANNLTACSKHSVHLDV